MVSVNGVVKGECPFDTQVKAGRVVVRAVRTVNAETERVFESSFTIGDDVIKRVDVVLGLPQLSADGLRQQALRRQQQEAEAARQRQAQLERAEQRRQAVVAALAAFEKQGVVPGTGRLFKDCEDCPAMVLVAPTQPGGEALAVGKFEITRGQFARFVRETGRQMPPGCTVWGKIGLFDKGWQYSDQRSWLSPGFEQTDDHPVVCVSWAEARDFALWLSRKTGNTYRLPKFNDYVSTGVAVRNPKNGDVGFPFFPSGNVFKWEDLCRFANVLDRTGLAQNVSGLEHEFPCDDRFANTAPVGSFQPNNSFGIHDLTGNVSELFDETDEMKVTERPTYLVLERQIRGTKNFSEEEKESHLKDVEERLKKSEFELYVPLSRKVIRGLSWASSGNLEEAARRRATEPELIRLPSSTRDNSIGFRVVRDLAATRLP